MVPRRQKLLSNSPHRRLRWHKPNRPLQVQLRRRVHLPVLRQRHRLLLQHPQRRPPQHQIPQLMGQLLMMDCMCHVYHEVGMEHWRRQTVLTGRRSFLIVTMTVKMMIRGLRQTARRPRQTLRKPQQTLRKPRRTPLGSKSKHSVTSYLCFEWQGAVFLFLIPEVFTLTLVASGCNHFIFVSTKLSLSC